MTRLDLVQLWPVAQLHLWQLAVEQAGLGDAWLNKRSHLHEARRLFNLVAQHKETDTELRLKALTDCGNSFDIMGRYLDALDCYERALKLDSSFGMAAGNRGITFLNVASLMGGTNPTCCYKPPLTWISPSAIKIVYYAAVGNQRSRFSSDGVPDCWSRRTHITVALSLPLSLATRISTVPTQSTLLHISPDCIRAGSETLDAVTFRNISLSLAEDPVLDRANEIVDAFNTIKQDYVVARYLVWLAAAEDSPIRGQANTITRRTSFWDSLNYASWGVRPGIGIQALKVTLDTLDTIAAFVHLYLHSGRGVRDIEFRTLPYAK